MKLALMRTYNDCSYQERLGEARNTSLQGGPQLAAIYIAAVISEV